MWCLWWLLWYIWCLWWILWYIWYSCDFWVFLNVKNKKSKLQWPLCRAFSGRRTAKWPKQTSETVPLSCVYRGARQRCHLLQCVLCLGTRQRALFAVRFFKAHGKEPIFAVCFLPGARQRASHAVTSRRRQLLLFAVRHEKTHDKDYLPCVVRRDAQQRGFTVQNATMCPLSCAPTKNAQQRVCRVF
jgi:hypothetical protein